MTPPLAGPVAEAAALLLLLAYVEAECRRIGAHRSADHAAQAAALVERHGAMQGVAAAPSQSRH